MSTLMRVNQSIVSHMVMNEAINIDLKHIVKQVVKPILDKNVVRVMSYNIRMAPCLEDDPSENAWSYRLPKVEMIFRKYVPDVVGVQEASEMQMTSLKEALTTDMHYEFIGKSPSRKPFECGLGIIYNTKKIELVSELKTIWLNESQEKPDGPVWDGSSYERYAIYARFKDLQSDQHFWFMTTHFDHLGIKARRESAKVVMDLAKNLDAPTILTGDFNCFPQLGGKELYELLCSHYEKMKDSEALADLVFGVKGSWIGWDYDPYQQKEGYAKYDHIFVYDTIQVLQHGIIDDKVWDSRFEKELYPSDHRPVLSDIRV